MRTFILASFLVLGVAYWALSGGSSYAPEAWPETGPEAAAPAEPAPVAPAMPEVTRADASPSDLAALALVEAPATVPAARAEPLAPGEALLALAPELGEPADAAPVPAPVPASVAEALAEPAGALRAVTGDRVNLRAGPGTGFDVVDQAGVGDLAEVLEVDGDWARVRVGGAEGWMSGRFLAAEG